VNGAAAGAGLSLAIAGDVVIGGESSRYLMAYSAIGLSPDGGATYYLPRLIGMRLTQEMAFLNRRLDAGEALAAGLISRVVADKDLQNEAEAIARRLATGPTYAFRRIKAMLAQSHPTRLGAQLDLEAEAIAACATTSDAAEGVNAFLDRRPAKFDGQ
jgi:2-(1,2-epoxy-1,2-dihydrophenyl)acetyl-CoA isomerase